MHQGRLLLISLHSKDIIWVRYTSCSVYVYVIFMKRNQTNVSKIYKEEQSKYIYNENQTSIFIKETGNPFFRMRNQTSINYLLTKIFIWCKNWWKYLKSFVRKIRQKLNRKNMALNYFINTQHYYLYVPVSSTWKEFWLLIAFIHCSCLERHQNGYQFLSSELVPLLQFRIQTLC